MDKKMLWMGIAGLILLAMMLGCGGVCAYYMARAWNTHMKEVDDPKSRLEDRPDRHAARRFFGASRFSVARTVYGALP